MLVARLLKAETVTLLTLTSDIVASLTVTGPTTGSPLLKPVWCSVFDLPAQWSVVLFVAAPSCLSL